MLANAGLSKHGLRVISSGEGKLTAMGSIVEQQNEHGYLCFADSASIRKPEEYADELQR